MDEDFRIRPSVLADLGPLPEVVESDGETAWGLFLQLEAQRWADPFSPTLPPSAAAGWQPRRQPEGLSVETVMAQARRFNRICPVEPEWLRLHELLAEAGGSGAPPPPQGAAVRTMPAIARRMVVRDQVEWAAERGCLAAASAFLAALPEDLWVHLQD